VINNDQPTKNSVSGWSSFPFFFASCSLFLLVHKPKVRPFFGPRVSHFLKGEPKIGIFEDRGMNHEHSNAPIPLANTVILASTSSLQQFLSYLRKETSKG